MMKRFIRNFLLVIGTPIVLTVGLAIGVLAGVAVGSLIGVAVLLLACFIAPTLLVLWWFGAMNWELGKDIEKGIEKGLIGFKEAINKAEKN